MADKLRVAVTRATRNGRVHYSTKACAARAQSVGERRLRTTSSRVYLWASTVYPALPVSGQAQHKRHVRFPHPQRVNHVSCGHHLSTRLRFFLSNAATTFPRVHALHLLVLLHNTPYLAGIQRSRLPQSSTEPLLAAPSRKRPNDSRIAQNDYTKASSRLFVRKLCEFAETANSSHGERPKSPSAISCEARVVVICNDNLNVCDSSPISFHYVSDAVFFSIFTSCI